MGMYFGPVGGPYYRVTKRGAQEGISSETIGSTSQSINGTGTQVIRAIKRRYQVNTRALSTFDFAFLSSLRMSRPIALRLYDDTMPNLLARDRREMQGWQLLGGGNAVGSTGGPPDPLTGMEILLAANSGCAPYAFTGAPVAPMIPWTGQGMIVGATVRTIGGSQSVSVGLRGYNAAGAYVSQSAASGGVTPTGDTRMVAYIGGLSASIKYVQPYVSNGANQLVVTDVTVVPGNADLGGAWKRVQFSGMSESHPSPAVRFATLTLAEI